MMKRREFLLGAALAGGAAALPLGIAWLRQPPLLDDPHAWVGRRFITDDGATLELVEVEQLSADARTTQSRLRFALIAGELPGEGMHAMRCGASNTALFLQSSREGAIACVNRLRGVS